MQGPYDPLKLAEITESIVCKGTSRKYTGFYCTGVYGGISTGYLVGCCLRCVFCWVELSREYPERYGRFYTPQEVASELVRNARKRGVSKVRVSGGEPTIGKGHLLKLLDLVAPTGLLFILETNGLLLGHDPAYAQALSRYKNLYVRISLKAGTAQGFQTRTGAMAEFYEVPYKGIEHALRHGLYLRVACMSDPRLMPKQERQEMIQRLAAIGYKGYLEEELCDPYDTTLLRLGQAGLKIF